MLVSSDPPHKTVSTPVEARLGLARLAFPDDDVVRDEHPYSIDTVSGFGDDAIFLVGADQFANFLTWREPDEILEHVRLGVATRPGYRREELERVLARLARPERVRVLRHGARAGLVQRHSQARPEGDADRRARAGGRRR